IRFPSPAASATDARRREDLGFEAATSFKTLSWVAGPPILYRGKETGPPSRQGGLCHCPEMPGSFRRASTGHVPSVPGDAIVGPAGSDWPFVQWQVAGFLFWKSAFESRWASFDCNATPSSNYPPKVPGTIPP